MATMVSLAWCLQISTCRKKSIILYTYVYIYCITLQAFLCHIQVELDTTKTLARLVKLVHLSIVVEKLLQNTLRVRTLLEHPRNIASSILIWSCHLPGTLAAAPKVARSSTIASGASVISHQCKYTTRSSKHKYSRHILTRERYCVNGSTTQNTSNPLAEATTPIEVQGQRINLVTKWKLGSWAAGPFWECWECWNAEDLGVPNNLLNSPHLLRPLLNRWSDYRRFARMNWKKRKRFRLVFSSWTEIPQHSCMVPQAPL